MTGAGIEMGAMKAIGILLLVLSAVGVIAGVLLIVMLPESAYDTPSDFDEWVANSDPGTKKTYKGALADETTMNITGAPAKAFRFKGCDLAFLAGGDYGNIGDEVILSIEVKEYGGMHYAFAFEKVEEWPYYVPGIAVLVAGLICGIVGLVILILGAVRKGKAKSPAAADKKQAPPEAKEAKESRIFSPPPPPPE